MVLGPHRGLEELSWKLCHYHAGTTLTRKNRKIKDNTAPFGGKLMRSQEICWAAQMAKFTIGGYR